MKRAASVMEVMCRAPGQEWTASEISVQLRCAPALVSACLRGHLLSTGQVERAGEGRWRLAQAPEAAPLTTREETRARLASLTIPPPVIASGAAVGEAPATPCPAQRGAILTALRDAGRPLERAALQTRTRKLAEWAPGDFFLTLTAMLEAGQVREWAGRTVVLPGYRGRL